MYVCVHVRVRDYVCVTMYSMCVCVCYRVHVLGPVRVCVCCCWFTLVGSHCQLARTAVFTEHELFRALLTLASMYLMTLHRCTFIRGGAKTSAAADGTENDTYYRSEPPH